jgi:hypothetical protein
MPITKVKFSASTDFKQVKVVASASPGTTIHTAHATAQDEIWAWASNPDSVDYDLTVEWGGTTDPDDRKTFTVPAKSVIPIVFGEILTNSLLMKAFGSAANKILINGFVNRLT